MAEPDPHAAPDGLRRAALEVLGTLAPEADLAALQPSLPLREQIDLDSMDWLNFAAALQDRLGTVIPEPALTRLVTLDDVVAYLTAAAPGGSSAGTPSGATRHHRLDGIDITLRPIRREDAAMEAEFVQRLSDQSRYQRFMGTVRELPEPKLRYLTDVDGVHHVAMVATTERDGRETEIGVARYVLDDRGTSCEFAIAVDDAWQHSGLAGLLMQALIDTARSHGIANMEGSVLASNLAMLRFARQFGFEVHADEDPTTRRITRSL
jgi:acetyltransferase